LKCNHGFELLLGHTFNPSKRSKTQNGQNRNERESERLPWLRVKYKYKHTQTYIYKTKDIVIGRGGLRLRGPVDGKSSCYSCGAAYSA